MVSCDNPNASPDRGSTTSDWRENKPSTRLMLQQLGEMIDRERRTGTRAMSELEPSSTNRQNPVLIAVSTIFQNTYNRWSHRFYKPAKLSSDSDI